MGKESRIKVLSEDNATDDWQQVRQSADSRERSTTAVACRLSTGMGGGSVIEYSLVSIDCTSVSSYSLYHDHNC